MKKSWILTLILLALAGTLQARTVKASSFGFDAKDATVCLKRAIASGAEKVIIDNVGKEWLSGPLVLRSNLELVLEKGVTLRAKSELFKERVIYFILNGKYQKRLSKFLSLLNFQRAELHSLKLLNKVKGEMMF